MSEHMFDQRADGANTCGAEFQACNLRGVPPNNASLRVAGLFAGIGGIEVGLQRAGAHAEFMCECWPPAKAVLAQRFPDVALASDIRGVTDLPQVDLVSAGFPCTDLSQAGRTRGIEGDQSSLVGEVFRLLRRRRAPLLLLENVRNMLVLDGGRAMRYLVDEIEELGYRWAYRLVDSRFTGVPQRRQRVLLVAALDLDPAAVLFADEAGEPGQDEFANRAFGFYWTEGLRGLGWARDAVPTLKGGSGLGIPSPPAIWNPEAPVGHRVVTPAIAEAEELQGLDADWTCAGPATVTRAGTRWKLVGNAVTVGVAEWVGRRLLTPGHPVVDFEDPINPGDRWPTAARGENGRAWRVSASLWPVRLPYRHLHDLVDLANAKPLSVKGAAGFLGRARRSTLRFVDGFLDDIESHIMGGEVDTHVA